MKKRTPDTPSLAIKIFPHYFSSKSNINTIRPSAAEERAARLLWDHLSEEQRQEVLSDRTITINSGGATLKLATANPNYTNLRRKGRAHFVSVCISMVSVGGLPLGDIILAKKLAFECDPDGFSKEARG